MTIFGARSVLTIAGLTQLNDFWGAERPKKSFNYWFFCSKCVSPESSKCRQRGSELSCSVGLLASDRMNPDYQEI